MNNSGAHFDNVVRASVITRLLYITERGLGNRLIYMS